MPHSKVRPCTNLRENSDLTDCLPINDHQKLRNSYLRENSVPTI